MSRLRTDYWMVLTAAVVTWALLRPVTLHAAFKIEPGPGESSTVATQAPPAVVAPAPPVETEVQRKQKEQAQLEALRGQQAQIAAETKTLQAVDAELAPVWPTYDFVRILARYQTLTGQVTTAEVKAQITPRLTNVRQLVDFKTQLIADINFAPYTRGDLVARDKAPLTGTLAKATADRLIFTSQYGEAGAPWGELPPEEVIRLAKFYAAERAEAETDAAKSRRSALLNAFVKKYPVAKAPPKPVEKKPATTAPKPPAPLKPYSPLQRHG
jgi:hypothetical protein